jgi:hypothetical protein
MGVALFIVPERPVEGLDTFVDGKALAHCRPAGAKDRGGRQAESHLEALAREAGVQSLMEFFSASPDDVRALLGEEDEEPQKMELPPEQWFPASEGLASVRGLLAHLMTHPEAAADVDRLIEDLRQFEEVLSQLNAAGIRWHLAVDI